MMYLHLDRLIPFFLQPTQAILTKYQSFSMLQIYLSIRFNSKYWETYSKRFLNRRQEIFLRRFISGKFLGCTSETVRSWSREYPGKTQACSNLCYLWPSFLTYATRGLTLREMDSLSYVPWEQSEIAWYLGGFVCSIRYHIGSLSSDYLVTYKNSFFPSPHIIFRKEDKHKTYLGVSNVGFCDDKSQLISHESCGSWVMKLYYPFSTPSKLNLLNEINLDF